MLLAPTRMCAYEDGLDAAHRDLALRLDRETNYLLTRMGSLQSIGVPPDQSWVRGTLRLSRSRVAADPLPRGASIGGSRGHQFAKLLRPSALLQYSRHPELYDEVWGERLKPHWVPDGFAEEAARQYERMLDQET